MRLSAGHRRLDPSMLRLPLIALIDVVLFLLFYFIVAGTIAPDEGELSTTLAIGRGQAKPDIVQAQVVRVEWVDAAPIYRVGERSAASGKELVALLREGSLDAGVVIRANEDAELEGVATAMQAAKEAGAKSITYVPLGPPGTGGPRS